MGFFGKLLKKEERPETQGLVAVAAGEMIPAADIPDPVFAQEVMGQTIGFKLSDGEIVAPCDGTLEVMYPTGHALAVRKNDGTGILVHIGIDTVNMNGKGFKVHAKQGDKVYAGQPLVSVNLSAVEKAGYNSVTMLVITEGDRRTFRDYGQVTKGELISQDQ